VCEFTGALAAPAGPFLEESGEASTTGRFGDYELLEEIAQGGMGVVYRARQLSLNRIVALKMIRPSAGVGSHFVQRFRTEAEAAARLQHTHIVAIHEVGEHEGRHFFSMEYVDGPNLQELTRQKPLAPKQAAAYLQAVAEAIHYAHQQGVLHRDLKPSNVLIGPSDQPKITDFGLAKVLTSDTELTMSGQVLGTPHYLPPEQASGKRGTVGPWSDVYGLGAILYQLLTGRPPFQAHELSDLLEQVLHREPVSPRLLNPSVPRDLETICLKCLEKEVARRYGSAQEVADDLGRHLRGETIVARPVGPPEKAWRWCRRKPALAGALAACAVALLLGVAGISWQWRRAEAESALAQRSLYDADMLLAQQAFEENNFGRVELLLRKHDPKGTAGPGEDLRGWEWHNLRGRIRSEELFTLGNHSNTVSYLAFSPDGRWLASASYYEFGNDVQVWDLQQRVRAATLPLQRAARVNIMAFSADNRTLAVADYGRVQFHRAPDWSEPVAGMTISNRFRSLTYSADGRLLVGQDGYAPFLIKVMDAQDFRIVTSWPAGDGRTLVLSPDGQFVAVQGRPEPVVAVYELATGVKRAQLPGPGGGYRHGNLLFSPDGRMLASVVSPGGEGEKWVDFWSVPDFQLIHRLQPTETHYTGVAFSPDSRQVYLSGTDQTISVYQVTSWTRLRTLHGHRDEVWCLAVSPDGRWLASGSRDETIRIWPTTAVTDAQDAWSLAENTQEVYLARDGQALATISSRGNLQVWRTSDFHCLAEMPMPFTQRKAWSNNQWNQVSVAPGGTLMAMANGTENGVGDEGVRLGLYEIPSLRQAWDLQGLQTWTASLAFSRDGSQLAAGGFFGENQALVWDVSSGRLLHTLTNVPGRSGLLRFSPRKTWLAVRLDEGFSWGLQVGLWKLPNPAREKVLGKRRHRVLDLAFSPDERCLATAGDDATLSLWDVATGNRLEDLTGQLTYFTAVAWSPDGDRLVAGGMDGSITIWDTASHQPVGRLKGHRKPIRGLAFLPQGDRLVSVSLDCLRVWSAAPVEPPGQ